MEQSKAQEAEEAVARFMGGREPCVHHVYLGQLPRHYLRANGSLAASPKSLGSTRLVRRIYYKLLIEDGGDGAFLELYLPEEGAPKLPLVPMFLTIAWMYPAFCADKPRVLGVPEQLYLGLENVPDQHSQLALQRLSELLGFKFETLPGHQREAAYYVREIGKCLDIVAAEPENASVDMAANYMMCTLSARLSLRMARFEDEAGVNLPHRLGRPLSAQELDTIAASARLRGEDLKQLLRLYLEDFGALQVQ